MARGEVERDRQSQGRESRRRTFLAAYASMAGVALSSTVLSSRRCHDLKLACTGGLIRPLPCAFHPEEGL